MSGAIARLAVEQRNAAWSDSQYIPEWVDPEQVDLDQFFTLPDVAQYCYDSFRRWMESDNAPLSDYTFIEPGAGTGSFFDLLPVDRRVGIDVMPFRTEYVIGDFLSWEPATHGRIAVIGNPPFGYRAWLALAFLNHAATFADYVGFILPMAFQSDGKGSPKLRVNGLRLLHSETLPDGCFVDTDGKTKKVNALWQVWQRGVNNIGVAETCDTWVDLFTVDSRAERRCGHERIHEADYFLQRTYFGDPPSLVRSFSEVRYGCGYGIVFKRGANDLVEALSQTDWERYSNLAAHNCRHISMYHIRQALTDAGFIDD